LLIATDVAARGIDVNDVTHVINYSLPDEIENYTHRSGRTGRAGKTGISIAIINSKEIGKIRQIERVIGKKFIKAEIPTGFDVCEKQLFGLIHKVHNVEVNDQQIEQYLPRIYDEFADLSKEDLIKRFASAEDTRFTREGASGERPERGNRGDFTRLFINLGSVDGFTRGDLLGYFCNQTGIVGRTIGKIDVKGVYSFLEVANEDSEKAFASFKDAQFKGREVRIEVSAAGGEGDRGESRGGFGGGYKKREGSSSYGGGNRRDGGSSNRGAERSGNAGGGGFRDFSGKRREDRGERRKKF
jgi:ATP-dependent RNA helicase DeaD